MTRVLITGGRGFLGRNLAAHLGERPDCEIRIVDKGTPQTDLERWLKETDVVFHLAGVNRPTDPLEFERGNTGFTERLCKAVREHGNAPKVIFSSSIQAELDNPYGVSKKRAEDALRNLATDTGACVRIYRLRNLFGKWCRPNFNSVTASFCHNIANDLPITISDPRREVEVSYVDDVVAAFIGEIDGAGARDEPGAQIPSYRIQLGDLAGRIQAFHDMRTTVAVPDFAHWFNRALYATYLSYVPAKALQNSLNIKSDPRGSLAEFIKGEHFGQIFISRTNPGVTRGNHYHHTKTEKFFVVEGDGLIRMRAIVGGPVQEYRVTGCEYQVIDIPPGVTHSITNVGKSDLITLFWSSELFDPNRTDTFYTPVEVEVDASSTVETA